MKLLKLNTRAVVSTLLALVISFAISAQIGGWNPELEKEAEEALQTMVIKTPKLKTFCDEAYGYAVFPRITKAAITIGGAIGNGIVYKDEHVVGSAKLKQASFGLQIGGQQYMEVIFFSNKDSFERFTNGKLKFDGQASAVILEEGASIDVAYQEGVAVFTMTKGGIMLDASIGGQHFKYKPKG